MCVTPTLRDQFHSNESLKSAPNCHKFSITQKWAKKKHKEKNNCPEKTPRVENAKTEKTETENEQERR